jgi:hypothetical protein
MQAGHFMIVSSLGQIAPKSAHDHETWSPPGTRAAGRMSGMGDYVLIEIALRDRVPQELVLAGIHAFAVFPVMPE